MEWPGLPSEREGMVIGPQDAEAVEGSAAKQFSMLSCDDGDDDGGGDEMDKITPVNKS